MGQQEVYEFLKQKGRKGAVLEEIKEALNTSEKSICSNLRKLMKWPDVVVISEKIRVKKKTPEGKKYNMHFYRKRWFIK